MFVHQVVTVQQVVLLQYSVNKESTSIVPGNDEASDCILCTPGSYCAGSGNTWPTGPCTAGWYCPLGQDAAQPTGYNCTQGHYCPEGSAIAVPCPSGSYQDLLGQITCKPCVAGYYCDSTSQPVVDYTNTPCPSGYYCPANTTHSTEYPCPIGTYNNLTHRVDISDCMSCAGGMYCDVQGLANPQGPCNPGYYCVSGATSSTPGQGDMADICPPGSFCPSGTVTPTSCPPGTYNPSTGRQTLDECTNCTGGYYCPNYNMTAPGPQCEAGYYCPSGAHIADFLQCPSGAYCPSGTSQPNLCPSGTYSNNLGLVSDTECTNCTGGFSCPDYGMTSPGDQCWGGYYCPSRISVPNPPEYICPVGMHCPNGSEIYKECSPGYYTNTSGAIICDVCPRGYYCLPVQPSNVTMNVQPCPAGYYCLIGTGLDWRPCPLGTYSDQEGLSTESQCKPCTGGSYCQGNSLTNVTGLCEAGYYCTSGVDRPNPSVGNETYNYTTACPPQTLYTGIGGLCPVGFYCPTGTTSPLACPAGTYADHQGMDACITCPQGYYCQVNSSNYQDTPCQPGYYCPNGTMDSHQYPCPPGTYNSMLYADSVLDCLPCPGGLYCEGQANTVPSGNCTGGWYCSGGADSPNTTTYGGQCQSGYYCPEGSTDPQPCPGGYYCPLISLSSPYAQCTAGYYCHSKATTATPTDGSTGDICPAGFYCEQGSEWPISCQPGTYGPSLGNKNQTDCIPCDYGQYCGDYNLTTTSGNCSRGFYCPKGQRSPNPYPCPVGHFCPENTYEPVLCPSGYYQDVIGQWDCKPCPAGYYCDNSYGVVTVNDTILCPPGYYCLSGKYKY
ncbi:hypothetical protein LSH36_283g03001 [Paralvinella palmiformis]|uniref:Chitin-binding type-2 domain-containing protein n=1 Tax=Paralvinella palmiformis TaxID=53620 RepID=A0AAD9N395_9ANNE|nr:hypothetical protein LSH36_283g03001 [Paralvinella palmiformis]